MRSPSCVKSGPGSSRASALATKRACALRPRAAVLHLLGEQVRREPVAGAGQVEISHRQQHLGRAVSLGDERPQRRPRRRVAHRADANGKAARGRFGLGQRGCLLIARQRLRHVARAPGRVARFGDDLRAQRLGELGMRKRPGLRLARLGQQARGDL
jgi:hypothetical protein